MAAGAMRRRFCGDFVFAVACAPTAVFVGQQRSSVTLVFVMAMLVLDAALASFPCRPGEAVADGPCSTLCRCPSESFCIHGLGEAKATGLTQRGFQSGNDIQVPDGSSTPLPDDVGVVFSRRLGVSRIPPSSWFAAAISTFAVVSLVSPVVSGIGDVNVLGLRARYLAFRKVVAPLVELPMGEESAMRMRQGASIGSNTEGPRHAKLPLPPSLTSLPPSACASLTYHPYPFPLRTARMTSRLHVHRRQRAMMKILLRHCLDHHKRCVLCHAARKVAPPIENEPSWMTTP